MALPIATLNLEHLRRRKGVSLDSIAEHTKIGKQFLRAIEAEEFEKLPGGVFNTSYIRQYAAAIDFSADELLAHYQAKMFGASEMEDTPVRSSRLRSCINWFRSPSPLAR